MNLSSSPFAITPHRETLDATKALLRLLAPPESFTLASHQSVAALVPSLFAQAAILQAVGQPGFDPSAARTAAVELVHSLVLSVASYLKFHLDENAPSPSTLREGLPVLMFQRVYHPANGCSFHFGPGKRLPYYQGILTTKLRDLQLSLQQNLTPEWLSLVLENFVLSLLATAFLLDSLDHD